MSFSALFKHDGSIDISGDCLEYITEWKLPRFDENPDISKECSVGSGVNALSGIPPRRANGKQEEKKAVVPCPPEQEELRDTAHVPGSGTQPCVVCLENRVRCVLSPCGHAQLCVKCAREICNTTELKTCPCCRKPIERAIILFTST